MNLLHNLPHTLEQERVDPLLTRSGIRVERIVSTGHASPEGFWYDQDQDEYVLLLTGTAIMHFEAEATPRPLIQGDWLSIPARTRHRVEATSPTEPTVWLALFLPPDRPSD